MKLSMEIATFEHHEIHLSYEAMPAGDLPALAKVGFSKRGVALKESLHWKHHRDS